MESFKLERMILLKEKGKEMKEKKEKIEKIKEIDEKKKQRIDDIKYFVKVGIICAAIILLPTRVISFGYIPSESMENTLKTGDLTFGVRYGLDNIKRYDIISFHPPDEPDSRFVKRVIGLPGETIVIEGNKVYADGVELDDSFIKEEMEPLVEGAYKIPEGCYFVLGDNRNNSSDSRLWDKKYVPAENIISKELVVFFPFQRIHSLAY